jgi:hypothetical protein
MVLTEQAPSSLITLLLPSPRHIPQDGTGHFPTPRHILAAAGCGPGTPGAARQGGVSWRAADGPHTQAGPGHPVLGRDPNRLCLQNLSTRFPSPTHHFP